MVLGPDKIIPVLYDLAMTMAGETRPYVLATTMLQRVMFHTGCNCGLLLLNPEPDKDGKSVTAQTYTAIGSPALRALEGETQQWSSEMLSGRGVQFVQGYCVNPDTNLSYVLKIDLPETGLILLFSTQPHENGIEQQALLAPVMAKFSRSLKHCLNSEKNARDLSLSEARIRDIFESTPNWIWETDQRITLTFSNGQTQDLLGYSPDELIGKTPFDFMLRQDAAHFTQTLRKHVDKHHAFRFLESVCLHKDGREVVLESRGTPIYGAEGNICGYRGVSQDITHRKQNEKALIKARDEAKASDRAKSLFLSSMSHEFRTPLNAILGYAQLIGMQDTLPENIDTSAEEILQAGKALLAHVDNLLELSRIESGDIELNLETVSIIDVIDACIAHNSGYAAWKKVSTGHICTCNRPDVTVDRSSFELALNQLISNAIKFNHAGGRVTISCGNVSSDKVRISVTDEGDGIDEAGQSRLFTPFNRLGAEKTLTGGIGIGLVIARHLVEAMSGTLGVQSTPGQGSIFWLEVPAANLDHPVSYTPPIPVRLSINSPQSVRILVAEDYAPNQSLLKKQLHKLGCEVDIASNGAEALELHKKNTYSLLLADINMPILDGLSLARAVREKEANADAHIPIICTTAAGENSEVKQILANGVNDILIKPIALEDLRRILTYWVTGETQNPAQSPPDATHKDACAPLNLDHLYKLLGETNEKQARKLIETFIESADRALTQLAPGDDTAALKRELHKLKSSSRTVGAIRFTKLAESLEAQLKEKKIDGNVPASLADLREELSRVSAVASKLIRSDDRAAKFSPALASYGSILVVDDDPVTLQQISSTLASLGVNEILTAASGQRALKLLNERDGELDTLICDLNMPEMDGVELIRRFARTGFKGGLVLMSGVDGKVLSTAGKLADLQGLHLLGQLQKPATPDQIVGLLTRTATTPAHKRKDSATTEISAQTIRQALDKDEFSIWFQPKVEASSLKPIGVEALSRWKHPVHGDIPPATFIKIAEREGLIQDLSKILLTKALVEGARLHEAGFPLSISANLSSLWLDDITLPDFILATTLAAKLRPSDVVLEVTETGVMQDLTTGLDVLTRLRLKGYGLSIDDFGIGYSSFEQLSRIPFTELKLDRSFVSKGAHDTTAAAILQSSMGIATEMGLLTVAEGVENETQLALIREMGCDLAQGYLIAKPMPVDKLIAWLKPARLNQGRENVGRETRSSQDFETKAR